MAILHLKIAPRLTIGLMLLAGLTVIVGSIAFLSFAHLRDDFRTIAQTDLPVIGAASQLSQQAQSIVASAPALVVADSQFARRALALRIVDQVTALDEFIKRLKEKGVGGERFAMLTELRGSLFDNLTTLDHAVETKLDLDQQIQSLSERLSSLDTDLKSFDSPESSPDWATSERLRQMLDQKADRKSLDGFAAALAEQEAASRAFHIWRFNAGQSVTALLGTNSAVQTASLDAMRKEIERRLDIGEWLLSDLPEGNRAQAAAWQTSVTALATGPGGILAARGRLIDTNRQIQAALAANKVFAERFDATAARVYSDIEREILDTSGAVSTLTERQTRLIFALTMLCIVAAAGILVFIRRSVINRLRRLQETMRTHVAGELAAIDTRGNDEIADMARALEFFVTTISEREIALAASESRLRSVTANLPGAVLRLFGRAGGPLVISYISEGVRELIARTPDSLIGVEDGILELMSAEDRPAFLAALARSAERHEQVFFEFRASNTDDYPGQTKWLRFLSFPRPGDDDETIWDGLILDSTEWKQADLAKRAFVSTVSHELRTPLTSIQGSLGLVAGGAMGTLPDGAKRLVEIANSNCQRLTRLINDILDIEKIELGHMEFDLKPQPLMPLLRQAVEANRGYGLPRGVRLKLIEIEPDLEINVDADRFIQVVNNLVSNAVKYSPEGGQVEVGAALRPDGVRIFVSDHGDGIPEGFRDRLFARFTQADSSDRRAKGGTGLGLSIAKAIIERFGGRIGFETADGQGTTFHFELPAALLVEQPAGPAPVQRVLVCEDDPLFADLIGDMITRRGSSARLVHTASGLKAALAEESFDALVLDLLLPDGDGIALLRGLRAAPETANLPVVIVSARAEEAHAEVNGSVLGILDWIGKPINPHRLTQALVGAMRPVGAGKAHILHVEDDEDLASVLNHLVGSRAEMTSVRTQRQAVELLNREAFDLIILDLGLPDGTGYELLTHLTAHKVHRLTPVLIFSAQAPDPDRTRQVADVLLKSVTSNAELLDHIQALLAGEHAPAGLASDAVHNSESTIPA
jgi:signal transduction histidine kinase/DNA-binding response OmpR family regulator/HAMP domain-containing protein